MAASIRKETELGLSGWPDNQPPVPIRFVTSGGIRSRPAPDSQQPAHRGLAVADRHPDARAGATEHVRRRSPLDPHPAGHRIHLGNLADAAWAGGTAPFQLEGTMLLPATQWLFLGAFSTNTTTVPRTSNAMFFRVPGSKSMAECSEQKRSDPITGIACRGGQLQPQSSRRSASRFDPGPCWQ